MSRHEEHGPDRGQRVQGRERGSDGAHSDRQPSRALDLLAGAIAAEDPPPLSAERQAEMLTVARLAATSGPQPRNRRMGFGWLAVAATVTMALGAGFWMGGFSIESERLGTGVALTSFSLPTGDELTFSGDATFDLRAASPEERVVELRRGAMLFDVRDLTTGQTFEVQTPNVTAQVRGTVFVVAVEGDATEVRVFEGQVAVVISESTAEERLLTAGETLRTGGSSLTVSDDLVGAARDAVARRLQEDSRSREAVPAHSGTTPPSANGRRGESEPPPLAETTGSGSSPARVTPDRADRSSRRTRRDRAPATSPPATPPLTLEEAQRLLVDGQWRLALQAATHAHTVDHAAWTVVEGDALRGLGRFRESVDAYDRAIPRLRPSRAAQVGYLSAWVKSRELGDGPGALASLDESRADNIGSSVQERALVLRARILIDGGDGEAARHVARRYLAGYPDGGEVAWMRRLAGSSAR